jgi:hypothetical protein
MSAPPLHAKSMKVAVLVHDTFSGKYSGAIHRHLRDDLSRHYGLDVAVETWQDSNALISIQKKNDHFLKPLMRRRGYDYVVTVKTSGRMVEFVAWSKNFFTGSVFAPRNSISRDDLIEVAVNSFLSIIEYTENDLYKYRQY